MSEQEKTEVIKRALGLKQVLVPVEGQVLDGAFNIGWAMDLQTLQALAEQAIVIECEVRYVAAKKDPIGWTHIERCDQPIDGFLLNGKHGTPGKAIAIVISLEEIKE